MDKQRLPEMYMQIRTILASVSQFMPIFHYLIKEESMVAPSKHADSFDPTPFRYVLLKACQLVD